MVDTINFENIYEQISSEIVKGKITANKTKLITITDNINLFGLDLNFKFQTEVDIVKWRIVLHVSQLSKYNEK
uniref:CSON009138 protein n=1 Tax=Culicoides sonorensis TaxID=179676 RepID=A0A336N2B5_CULSO